MRPCRRWGGQWVRQYGFVHLHQNRLGFSAGTRPWVLGKPDEYLPDKHEIMKHFESIAAAVTAEHRVDLVELFGYRYTGHRISGGKVSPIVVRNIHNVAAFLRPAATRPPNR